MVGMRGVRRAGSPDGAANPQQRSKNHVDHRANYKDLERAGPTTEIAEELTQNTIVQAEEKPRDKARSQQMPGHSQESKNRDQCDEHQKRGPANTSHGQVFERRHAVGNEEPRREYQRQAHRSVHAESNRRVAKNVEPTITG